MAKVLLYTITSASTSDDVRQLISTLTSGRDSAGIPLEWHVWVNGSSLAKNACEALLETRVIDGLIYAPYNKGQHIATNAIVKTCLQSDYTSLIRIDDDIAFLTKSWLRKLVDASEALNNDYVLLASCKTKRVWYPDILPRTEINKIPLRFIAGPAAGACRLIPTKVLQSKPFVSDVRLPMGTADAACVARWCMQTPITPMAQLDSIRIKHLKDHDVLDINKYVPWIPTC